MKIINDAALRFSVPPLPAQQILNNIKKSELLGGKVGSCEVLLSWDHHETSIATEVLDFYQPDANLPDIPSPMIRDYKWSGFYKPFDHQKITASFLSLRRRAFCFNEQGTGKTPAAIWAADYLMELGLVKRALIICPLSIMYSAWQQDIFRTAMHRTVAVAYGPNAKRRAIIREGHEFLIINYDGVNVVFDEIQKIGFDLIIADEANAFKNTATRRWRNLAKLLTPTTRLWMMTGTPAAQSPFDAFGLAKLVAPARVPKYSGSWRDKVMYQVTRFKWVPKTDSKTTVHRALQPAIRYTKSECLDLPDITYQTRDVPMTPQAALYYRNLKAQLQIEAAGQQISAVNAAASLSKLLQISGGAVYTDKHDIVEFDIGPRLQALQEVLDETLHKVIIFVPYLHTIDVVSRYLEKHRFKHEIIRGAIDAKKRAQIISEFQAQTDPRVLIIQPQAASHGVTLTAADTIVFWSPVMSVETYLQCIGRIDRVGQVNKMTVVHIQGSDVERKVYKMLHGRVDSHLQLVELYKQELGIES